MFDIAREAGVSRQSVYRYAGNKSEIIRLIKGEKAIPEENRLDMQHRILVAASRIMARHGYDHTSMAEVAKEAGCSKGAVYWHFPEKQELLLSLVSYRMTDLIAMIPDMFEKAVCEKHPLTGLTEFWKQQLERFQSDDGDEARLWLEFFIHTRTEEVKRRIQESLEPLYTRLAIDIHQLKKDGKLAPALDPEETAAMIIHLLNGIIVEGASGWKTDNPDKRATQMARMLWNGIAP